MSDLIERLRAAEYPTGWDGPRLEHEAADELERLNRENADVECHNAELGDRLASAEARLAGIEAWERERLAEAEKWKDAAMFLGEGLSDVGPEGYYEMTPQEWLSWVSKRIDDAAREGTT